MVSSFFLPVPPAAGGAMEKIWFRLAREFAAAGHEVAFISRAWPAFPERETIDGIRMIRAPGFNHTPRLWRNLLLDFLWGLRAARRLPPGDIVVCNTVSLPVYLRLLRPSSGRVVAVLGRMPKGHAKAYGRVDRLIATSAAVRARVILENPRLESRTRVIPNPIDWEVHQAHARKAVRLGGGDDRLCGPAASGERDSRSFCAPPPPSRPAPDCPAGACAWSGRRAWRPAAAARRMSRVSANSPSGREPRSRLKPLFTTRSRSRRFTGGWTFSVIRAWPKKAKGSASRRSKRWRRGPFRSCPRSTATATWSGTGPTGGCSITAPPTGPPGWPAAWPNSSRIPARGRGSRPRRRRMRGVLDYRVVAAALLEDFSGLVLGSEGRKIA